MGHPSNSTEEEAESINPRDDGLRFEFVRSESHAPAEPKEALLKIS